MPLTAAAADKEEEEEKGHNLENWPLPCFSCVKWRSLKGPDDFSGKRVYFGTCCAPQRVHVRRRD